MRLVTMALLALLYPVPGHAQDEPPATDAGPAPEPATEPGTPEPESTAYDTTADNERTALSRRLPRRGFDQRTLKDHAFEAPKLFDDALVTSHLGVSSGLGGNYRPQASGGDGTYTRAMGGVGAGLDLGIRFGKFVGVFGSFRGTMAIGLNSTTAYQEGASGNITVRGGVAVRLARFEKSGTQLTLKPKYVGDFSMTVRPAEAAAALSASPTSETSRLFVRNQGGLSVDLAQAFSKTFSLQASVEYLVGAGKITLETEQILQDVPATTHDVAAGISPTVDLWPHVPVAFQVEYRIDWVAAITAPEAPQLGPWLEHRAAASLYYSGHPDFQLGVTVLGILAGGEDADRYGGRVLLSFRAYL